MAAGRPPGDLKLTIRTDAELEKAKPLLLKSYELSECHNWRAGPTCDSCFLTLQALLSGP